MAELNIYHILDLEEYKRFKNNILQFPFATFGNSMVYNKQISAGSLTITIEINGIIMDFVLRCGILPRVRRKYDKRHEFQVTKEETRHVRPHLSGR